MLMTRPSFLTTFFAMIEIGADLIVDFNFARLNGEEVVTEKEENPTRPQQ